jgi:xylulokinase
MDGLIKASSPGANKVIFLPWMYGERAPIPDIYARGCFFNLSLDHKISDVARALVEGIGFNLRWISELVEENTGVSHDYFPASGGFLRSRTVSEVITDVLQKEIRVVRDIVESVAEGAALMAMVGAGKYHSLAEAVQNIRYQYHYHPNEEYEEVYGELYEVYKEMHDYLADAYAALNG